jgi:hypothetical protein
MTQHSRLPPAVAASAASIDPQQRRRQPVAPADTAQAHAVSTQRAVSDAR